MDSLDPADLIPQVLRDRAVFPVYQPIVDLDSGTLVGVEALARGPANSAVEMPSALFAAASRAGLLALVDQLCFARAIEIARGAADLVPPLLFANAEPAAINQPMLPDLLAALREERRFRIVMEYTERGLTSHPAALLSLANFAHREGALALDDVGADPMSLALLPLLEPEVVKLDIQLLRNPHSRNTVETAAIVGSYAERTGAMVVAEGIETDTDLKTAKALGAHWGQGWLLGRPGPLTRIAGRRAHGSPALPPSQPDLHVPSDSPFSLAAAGRRTRAGDRQTVDELTEYLLSTAAKGDSHTIILGAYPDRVVGEAWLARLRVAGDTAAFVAFVGPEIPGAGSQRTTVATHPGGTELALAVISSHAAAALCARPASAATMELVVTHEPNRVYAVARKLLLMVGAATEPQSHANAVRAR